MERNSLPNLSALSLRQEATGGQPRDDEFEFPDDEFEFPTFNNLTIDSMRYLDVTQRLYNAELPPAWYVTIALALYVPIPESGYVEIDYNAVTMTFSVTSSGDTKNPFTAELESSTATKMEFSKEAWRFLQKEKFVPVVDGLSTPGSKLGTNQDFHRAVLVAMGMPNALSQLILMQL